MSEFINNNHATIRWNLLTSASVLALVAYITSGDVALAEDGNHPQVWIELGGQLGSLSNAEEAFSPPLMEDRPSIFSPSAKFEKLPSHSIDETGKIAFEPSSGGWVFSGSVRFGRSGGHRDVRQQTSPNAFVRYLPAGTQTERVAAYPIASQFAETTVHNGEQHLIVDFQVGKDVGLGMLRGEGSSLLNFGIRFAQFQSSSNIVLNSDPDWHFNYKYLPNGATIPYQAFHTNRATLLAERSFHGVGPSLSWVGSTPFVGNPQDGELSFDGGVSAAVLFGRQRAQVHHQSSGRYRSPVIGSNAGPLYVTQPPSPVNKSRSRSIVVPNVGGFAGLSYRLQDFKVNAGYRADFFFGAMDGGIDERKTKDVGYFGPFATVSIGLGG